MRLPEPFYPPFGRVLLDTNPGIQPFGFAGGLYDPDTTLVRFGARDYDPEVGRWTAKDPKLFRAGRHENVYSYGGNDPVNLVDWTGKGVIPIPRGSGNYREGFDPQKPGCDVIGGVVNRLPSKECYLDCCEQHDRCYERHRCNASSWINSILWWMSLIPPSDLPFPCVNCNRDVVSCFLDVFGRGCSCKTSYKP